MPLLVPQAMPHNIPSFLQFPHRTADAVPPFLTDGYQPMHGEMPFLAEVTIKARYPQKRTLLFEQSIDAYYDVQAMIDQMRDEGKEIFTLYDFLNKVNPEIRLQEGKQIIYRGKSLPLAVDGKIMRNHQRFLIEEDIDAIKTLVISSGSGAKDEIGKLDFEEALTPIKEDFEELEEEMEITKASEKKATDKQYGKSLTEEPTAIAYIVSADAGMQTETFVRLVESVQPVYKAILVH